MRRFMWTWILWTTLVFGVVLYAQDQPPEQPAEEEAAADAETSEPAEAAAEPVAAEQPEPEPEAAEHPPPDDPNPLGALYVFLNAGGIMGLAQLLRYFKVPQRIPSFLRPLIGPAIALIGSYALQLFGAPLDLSAIEVVLIGSGAGTLFGVGSAAGLFSSKKGANPLLSSTGTGK